MTTLLPMALGLLLQSTALLLLGLVALRLARRRGPAVQSLVGRATLAGVALALILAAPLTGHVRPLWRVTPPTTSVTPAPATVGGEGEDRPPAPDPGGARNAWALPAVPSAPPSSPAPPELGARERFLPAPVLPPAPPRSSDDPTHTLQPSSLRLYPALAATWGTGAALLLLWLGVCQRHLTRLRRQAHPITSGPAAEVLAALTPRPPALLAHPSIRSPFLAGLWRPAIFLPTAYDTDFDPTALRAILAHELAHLARRDNAWTLAARLLCALLWPQPLLWVLCRRLEQIGEEACDQAVLAHACPPRAYADCLLTLAARHPLPRRERALGAGVAPFQSSLGRRIGRILDKGTHAMSTVSPRLRLTVAALAAAAALGGAFLVSSAPAQVDNPTVDKSSLIGTWLASSSGMDQQKQAITFDADGQVTLIDETKSRQSGRYTISGSKLTITITRIAYGHNAPLDQKPPQVNSVGFTLTGDTLTVRRADGKIETAHRVTDFTEDMLRPEKKATIRPEANGTDPELQKARFLAGLTPVQGPGVVVTLNDSKKSFPGGLPSGMTPPNIIHDTDINQVVNELKAAGAEAIAVNDQRLIATSPIRCAGPTVFVNNIPLAPPFAIGAISNPKTLAAAMNTPGGVAGQIRNYDPAMFSVREATALALPSFSGRGEPRYAKPVSTASQEAAPQKIVGADHLQALTQQRERLQAQLVALNAEAVSLTAQVQRTRTRIQAQLAQALRKLTPPSPHGTNSRNRVDPERQALASQLAAAQADLDQKRITMGPQNPALLKAQQKVQSLEKAYRELPIREKQQFVQQVIRWQVALSNALVDTDKPMSRQLSKVQRQQEQLRLEIDLLGAQIASHNGSAPGR